MQLKIPLFSQQSQGHLSSSFLFKSTKYNPFAIPPDIEMAISHGKATRVSRLPSAPSKIDDSSYDRCQCCNLLINNQLIPLGCKIKQMANVGIAYCNYFQYIKLCFILVASNLILSGITQLVLNYSGEMCSKLHDDSLICRGSVINILNLKDTTSLKIQNILNSFFILVCFVLIEGFKIRQKIMYRKFKSKVFLVEDYSVVLSCVDRLLTIQQINEKVSIYLQNSRLSQNDKRVIKIYYLCDLQKYMMLYNQQFEYIRQSTQKNQEYQKVQKKVQNDQKSSEPDLNKLLSEIHSLDRKKQEGLEKLHQFQTKFYQQYKSISIAKDIDKTIKFSGKIVITLNSVAAKKYLLENFHTAGILKCSNPTDIFYTNIVTAPSAKISYTKPVTYLSLALICDFFILTALKKFIKVQQSQTVNQVTLIILSAISSIVCCGFNTLLGMMMRYYERTNPIYQTHSSYYGQLGKQLTAIFMVNMLATTYFSNAVSFWIISYGQATYPHFPINFLGLIYDFFFLFITNSYASSIMSYFDIVWGWRLYKRNQIKSKLNVTQSQANSYFQNHPIDISLRYANVNKVVLITAAMVPIMPVGLQFTLVALIILYWIDKYLLLRRFTCKHKFNNTFSKEMMEQLQIYPFLVAFFNVLVMFIPVEEYSNSPSIIAKFIYPNNQTSAAFYFAILMLVLSIWYRLSKKNRIRNVISYIYKNSLIKEFKNIDLSYQTNRERFMQDYSDNYPYFQVTKNGEYKCYESDLRLFGDVHINLQDRKYHIKQ